MKVKTIFKFLIIIAVSIPSIFYYNTLDIHTTPWKQTVYNMYIQSLSMIAPSITMPLSLPSKKSMPLGFKSTFGNFALISDNNIAVYKNPDSESMILHWVSLGLRVTPLVIEDDWVLIQNWNKPQKLLGWIPRSQIAFLSDFKPIKVWHYSNFKCIRGDYIGNYAVKPNAAFKVTWKTEGQGLMIESSQTGHLYQFKSLLFAKEKDSIDNEWPKLFIIHSDNTLSNEPLYIDYPATFTLKN